MRIVAVIVVLAIAGPARADSFLDLEGGIAAPVGDSSWTNSVGTSPKLAAHVGALNDDQIGGMLAVDWTPETTNTTSTSFPGGSTDISAFRFRILAELAFQHRITPKLTISGRAGAGVDIAHASYAVTILGATSSNADTDTGYAFEFGGGIWYDVGSTQIGAELALPIGHHSHDADKAGDIAFDYTSYDIDLLFGVRLWSH